MRRLIVHMQTTLNNRIANADGGFWEPFAWGEEEQAWLNESFRAADTWILSRLTYEAIVPWWAQVAAGQLPDDVQALTAADREFAAILDGMDKVVFSRTMDAGADRRVVTGDLVSELRALKGRVGRDILLSCGPATLAPLARAPGLIDEYLVVVQPAVVAAGPGMFDHLNVDLALELVESRAFERGAVALRYKVVAIP